MSNIIMGNDEFIHYLRKQYPDCQTENDTLGRQIWIWLRNTDANAQKVQEEPVPCYWNMGNDVDFMDATHLPQTATQFEFDRDILPELYDYLDTLGLQGSV